MRVIPSIICTRRHDHLPELVDRAGLGPGDDVVGAGDVLGGHDAVDVAHLGRHLGGLADLGLDQDVRADGHRGGSVDAGTGRSRRPGRVVTNLRDVDAHDRLIARVASEQEDVLCTLQLCGHDDELRDRLWGQLVDLLVEGMFLELRRAYLRGELDREAYVDQLTTAAERCRSVGLLPLPARGL